MDVVISERCMVRPSNDAFVYVASFAAKRKIFETASQQSDGVEHACIQCNSAAHHAVLPLGHTIKGISRHEQGIGSHHRRRLRRHVGLDVAFATCLACPA